MKIIKSDSSAVGIVINPYSHNLVLNRDKLDSLKLNVENIKQNERVSIGFPAEYPRKLVNDCTHCFKQESEINKAYMLQMIRENLKKSLLLVIDSSNDEKMLPYISNYVQKFLEEGMILDTISFDSDFGRNVTKEYKPFYEK